MINKLLIKDFKLLKGSSTSVIAFAYLTFILSFIAAFGLNIAILNYETKLKLLPVMNYLIFSFISNSILSRCFESDNNNSAIINLKLSGYKNYQILLSKMIINYALLLFGSLLCLFLLCFFNSLLHTIKLSYIIILAIVVLNYTIIGLTFSALFQNIRLKNILLPIVNLPVSLPIFLAGLSLSYSSIYDKPIIGDHWLNLLWGCLVLYSFIAIKLSEHLFSYENS